GLDRLTGIVGNPSGTRPPRRTLGCCIIWTWLSFLRKRMAMKKSTRLRFMTLERRDVPAQFGVPWADHHLSMSFAPDGTSVDGVGSNLSAFFAAANIPSSTWKGAILSAVQTWSATADLTVGLVDDDGSAIGVSGRPQHDLRFGDIRISGRPL